MNRIELGELLKRKRKEAGLTLALMVEKLKATDMPVSVNYLSSLERGGVELPNLMRLRQISICYGLEPGSVSEVFYPNEALIQRESKVNTIFNSIIYDPMFDSESRERMLKEKLGMATKVFLIRLYEKEKKTVLLPQIDAPLPDRPQTEDDKNSSIGTHTKYM